MTLQKVLYAALTGCVGIILTMVTLWAQNVSTRQTQFDIRISAEEAHYAAIDVELKDLHMRLEQIQAILDKERQ